MGRKKKILLIDLLHVLGGSLEDDITSIKAALSEDYETKYIKISASSGLFKSLKVFFDALLFFPSKIVFLSSRVNQLFIFIPLCLFSKCYFIYHFMPSCRIKFHSYALPLLAMFYKIGVYSQGVSKVLINILGYAPEILPSRIIDSNLSIIKLHNKIYKNRVNLLIPGVRPGVRNDVDLPSIIATIKKLGIEVDTVYIQSESKSCEYYFPEDTLNIKTFRYLEISEYTKIFSEALFIAIDFDKTYEVRASGVILDALNNGNIVITNDHPIVFQYGYPNTTITNLENIHKIISKIKNSQNNNFLIEGCNFESFRKAWNVFLS